MDTRAQKRVLACFEEEAGDAPSDELQGWELCLLSRFVASELGLALRERRRLEQRLLRACEGKALAACWECLALRAPQRKRAPSRSRSCKRPPPPAGAAASSPRRAEGPKKPSPPPQRRRGLAAPVCLGPPVFFPVGNAAGRHPPLSSGLATASAAAAPRLLFVGASDPRHLLEALLALPAEARPCLVSNDLNAEACARSALILELLRVLRAKAGAALLLLALWWTHELPVSLLPCLADAAASSAASGCCPATAATLRRWGEIWRSASDTKPACDLRTLLEAADVRDLPELADAEAFLSAGCVDNITLQHSAAKLDYGLYRDREPPEGWLPVGDGVLLWPEPGAANEFDPDSGQPPRVEYLAALARNAPLLIRTLTQLANAWFEGGRVECEHIAGDGLQLPGRVAAGFHRIFTSNVADHVGLPALALELGPLLAKGGQLRVCLSNNMRALASDGEAEGLVRKIHGIPLRHLAAACGLEVEVMPPESVEADHIWLVRREACASRIRSEEALRALQEWPAECARRLHRCPEADGRTVARRTSQGERLGMALRYARRFTVSPVTAACIGRLLERAAEALPPALAAAAVRGVVEAAPHASLSLAEGLARRRLPASVVEALEGQLQPCQSVAHCSFTVGVAGIPTWAWRTRPPVVLLWVRAAGLASAAQGGLLLAPTDNPVWGTCRREKDAAFLRGGVWGALRWAVEAPPDSVQILDDFKIDLQEEGRLQVSFELPTEELQGGKTGSAAFLLSTVDNAIVTGPHWAADMLLEEERGDHAPVAQAETGRIPPLA